MVDDDKILQAIPQEIALDDDPERHLDTYIFEPGPSETALGQLYLVGEVAEAGGVGQELLDLVSQALQKEYYRDPSRGLIASFESALHQANLVLHDTAESGIRDWLTDFHIAIAALAGRNLVVSVAGTAQVLLIRKGRATEISEGLTVFPISNPLRTFAQVAQGTLSANDILLLSSPSVTEAISEQDFAHLATDPSPATIIGRLQDLYSDRGRGMAASTILVSMLTRASKPVAEKPVSPAPKRSLEPPQITSRQPIKIRRSLAASLGLSLLRGIGGLLGWIKATVWPLVVRGSQKGARAAAHTSSRGWKKIRSGDLKPAVKMPDLPSPKKMVETTQKSFWSMPKTTKVFAVIALLLAVSLVISVFLLRSKRAEDATIQRASELLHDAETKQAAAETALIYDNRDQARNFLGEVEEDIKQIEALGLYQEETVTLLAAKSKIEDRLQRLSRSSNLNSRVVGDFADIEDVNDVNGLALIGETLYSWQTATNNVLSMSPEGETTKTTETSAGIGFLEKSVVQSEDQTITFLTDGPGIAIFDARDNTLSDQEIQFASAEPDVTDIATYGSRLYLFDKALGDIVSYSKNLRGYGSATSWLNNKEDASNIMSLAVDGNIYALEEDGTLKRFFKGDLETDWEAEPVTPGLSSATQLVANEELTNIYIFDPSNQRVVIFDKDGKLVQQVIIDVATSLQAVVISSDEKTLYALDGTRVIATPLEEQEEPN